MKYLKIGVIVLIMVVLPWFIWQVQSDKKIKFVMWEPTEEKESVSGLSWLLKYMKIPESVRAKDAGDLEEADVIYVPSSGSAEADGQTDRLNLETLGGIRAAESKRNATVIFEFDSLTSHMNSDIHSSASELVGIRQTGWTGRFMKDLSKSKGDLPEWSVGGYENTSGQTWSFTGPGYLFVNEKTEEVIVLSEQKGEVEDAGNQLRFTEKGKAYFDLTESPLYEGWFDVVENSGDESVVMAEFSLSLTAKGEEHAKTGGLPDRFPAIVQNRGNYYLAGKYSATEEVPSIYQYAGYAKMHQWVSGFDSSTDRSFFWRTYVPVMQTILKGHLDKEVPKKKEKTSLEKTAAGLTYSSRIEEGKFEVFQDGVWKPMTVKGVNLGMGRPGSFPGEAAITKEEYSRWFKEIGEMNANTIRVYTLHPPAFYDALLEYNESHDQKLYVLHGVWADEAPLEETLDAYTPEIVQTFEEEMKRIADVIHGNATVKPRPGHASGVYGSDISEYMAGWVIGIEWYPYMVANMKELYAGRSQYEGKHIRTKGGEGFELWLAERMDHLLSYEAETYGWTRPISYTNWVTTDHLEQPAEPSEQEDMASIHPDHIQFIQEEQEAGMFASYHVYPYYPDFLNLEKKYTEFIDHRGEKNNYAGYLHDLHQATKTPILIAEFGMPASRGMTHENVNGWNQGFHSEKEQGHILSSLYEDIVEEGLMGGLVFTWQDEWFKRTWNTMDLDDPDRRPFWSNVQTNEQNFGLLSFNTLSIQIDGATKDWKGIKPIYESNGTVERMYVHHDEAYLYLRADLKAGAGHWLQDTQAHFLLDIASGQGSRTSDKLPHVELERPTADFHIKLTSEDDSEALVQAAYDPFYYMYGVELNMLKIDGRLPKQGDGVFHPIRFALNKEMTRPDTGEIMPFSYYETGKLQYGNGNPKSASYDSLTDFAVSKDGRVLEVRLPWLLLNFKDPSQREVMGNLYGGDGLASSQTIDDIGVYLVTTNENGKLLQIAPNANEGYRYTWDTWEEPPHSERLKQSYYILQRLFKTIE
ncbi:hypothetical protein [Sporosarcina sp. Te-1]|uniref:hypothetical protein n=1 Tax=Sporosarcina sp. Te-1 TaxID=2818390 RepID=UPI001A9ED630|nr:hypothetical protein [Sporosarcina sp. Te-1]QTD39652.1 hypothetical protein J3U78_12410 [Sporosarcina sp. Te-1]